MEICYEDVLADTEESLTELIQMASDYETSMLTLKKTYDAELKSVESIQEDITTLQKRQSYLVAVHESLQEILCDFVLPVAVRNTFQSVMQGELIFDSPSGILIATEAAKFVAAATSTYQKKSLDSKYGLGGLRDHVNELISQNYTLYSLFVANFQRQLKQISRIHEAATSKNATHGGLDWPSHEQIAKYLLPGEYFFETLPQVLDRNGHAFLQEKYIHRIKPLYSREIKAFFGALQSTLGSILKSMQKERCSKPIHILQEIALSDGLLAVNRDVNSSCKYPKSATHVYAILLERVYYILSAEFMLCQRLHLSTYNVLSSIFGSTDLTIKTETPSLISVWNSFLRWITDQDTFGYLFSVLALSRQFPETFSNENEYVRELLEWNIRNLQDCIKTKTAHLTYKFLLLPYKCLYTPLIPYFVKYGSALHDLAQISLACKGLKKEDILISLTLWDHESHSVLKTYCLRQGKYAPLIEYIHSMYMVSAFSAVDAESFSEACEVTKERWISIQRLSQRKYVTDMLLTYSFPKIRKACRCENFLAESVSSVKSCLSSLPKDKALNAIRDCFRNLEHSLALMAARLNKHLIRSASSQHVQFFKNAHSETILCLEQTVLSFLVHVNEMALELGLNLPSESTSEINIRDKFCRAFIKE